MKRRLYIAGNWKLNKSAAETSATAELKKKLAEFNGALDVALSLPISLSLLVRLLQKVP